MVSSAFADDYEDGLVAYKRGDYATALSRFRKAAKQGDADAQFALGAMYEHGQGVPLDYKTSVYWYNRAAEQGDASAQYELGYMYWMGRGVPVDRVLGYVWSSLAAAQGHKYALEARGWYRQYMTREQIAEAQRLAREWNPRQQTAQAPQHPPKQENPRSAPESPRLVGSGTGFYVSAEGHVLTNEHVINQSKRFYPPC